MSSKELEEFLRGPHIARIAVVKDDGSPFIVPVWYEWDGRDLYIVARKRSNWVNYIRRDSRVCVLIDEDKPPLRKVIIEGNAEIVGGDWIEIGRRMVVRYFGPELGPKYLEGSLDQPRWVIKITPKKITSWMVPPEFAGGKEAWHPRYYEPGTKWYEEYQQEKHQKKS
jgi:PPOX class probable F420-dependent enzyme